jgi:hypothetical protein
VAGGVLRNASLPFTSLDVYHGFHFTLEKLGNDIDRIDDEDLDSVKANPGGSGRFDTVIVMVGGQDSETTGLQGSTSSFSSLMIKY